MTKKRRSREVSLPRLRRAHQNVCQTETKLKKSNTFVQKLHATETRKIAKAKNSLLVRWQAKARACPLSGSIWQCFSAIPCSALILRVISGFDLHERCSATSDARRRRWTSAKTKGKRRLRTSYMRISHIPDCINLLSREAFRDDELRLLVDPEVPFFWSGALTHGWQL